MYMSCIIHSFLPERADYPHPGAKSIRQTGFYSKAFVNDLILLHEVFIHP
jgi:hypothetical protein